MWIIVFVAALLVSPVGVFADDYDCSDFTTQHEAQQVLENAAPGNSDRVDRDQDWIACETLS